MTTTWIGTKLGLRKITARIGAEVTGVSPSLELDPGTVTAIRAALSEQAVHTNGYDYAVPPESLNETERERRKLFISTTYETVHPVVRVHPLTGERGLFTGGVAPRSGGGSPGGAEEQLAVAADHATAPG